MLLSLVAFFAKPNLKDILENQLRFVTMLAIRTVRVDLSQSSLKIFSTLSVCYSNFSVQ